MRKPWHLWVIGVLALVWNAGGAFDYVMTQIGSEDYLSQLSDAQRAYMDAVPGWFVASWAVGVWFAVLGSLLLLVRSRMAVAVFALSLLGLIVSSVYSFGLSDPSAMDVMGTFALYFSGAIFVVLVLLWIYARAMTRRGVLR